MCVARELEVTADLVAAAVALERRRDHQQQLDNHIHHANHRYLQRTSSGPVECLCLHKVGPFLLLPISSGKVPRPTKSVAWTLSTAVVQQPCLSNHLRLALLLASDPEC